MDWALNDPKYGAYSSGKLKIGPRGDFATSPSLGSDFAELLAIQLVDWLEKLQERNGLRIRYRMRRLQSKKCLIYQ